jgi:hypothetical protein
MDGGLHTVPVKLFCFILQNNRILSAKSYKTTASPDHTLHRNTDICDPINDEVRITIP